MNHYASALYQFYTFMNTCRDIVCNVIFNDSLKFLFSIPNYHSQLL